MLKKWNIGSDVKCHCRVHVSHASIQLIPYLEYGSLTRTRLIHPALINLTVHDIQLFPLKWYDRDREIPFGSAQVTYVKPVGLKENGYHDDRDAVFQASLRGRDAYRFCFSTWTQEERKRKWQIEFLRVLRVTTTPCCIYRSQWGTLFVLLRLHFYIYNESRICTSGKMRVLKCCEYLWTESDFNLN